ncbi:ricin-type beta-trefoil lectin domain protein [Actinoplanes sp. RD1]|uniref:ricin-type beta-trefoil lectin domain protein n=1 Tax=Actinoplanes sp. RD1 TaxID=3064538 RepID=UPI0027410E3A|nr:ricin-type beta-trefoil lectin domain protein [Actinoplanes sp. RD1]
MTDKRDFDEPAEPVLVRPYIAPVSPAVPPRLGEKWPERAPVEQPTGELPVQPPPAPAARPTSFGRQRLLVLAGVTVLAAGILGTVLVTGGDDDEPATVQPTFPLASATADLGGGSAGPARQSAAPDPGVAGSARVSRGPGPSGSAGTSTGPSGAPASQAPAAPGAPAAPPGATSAPAADPTTPASTLSPAPGTAVTGKVKAASSGRCLALGGLLGVDGTPIVTNGCSNISYQSFTFATDGTLRVAGHCAEATSSGEVKSTTCGDAATSQWRAGAAGTLVNLATGGCLTDGGGTGKTSRVEPCTGAANQGWALP